MQTRLRIRTGLEAALALIGLAAAALTVINAEWIEALTGLEPDAGSGALEWAIAFGFLVAGAVLAILARRDWTCFAGGRSGQYVSEP